MMEKKWLGHIAALTCVSVWGFAFVALVILLREFSPLEILLFRFSLAAVALYLIYPRRMERTTWRQELLFAAAGLFGVTAFFLLQDFALLNTAASNVSLIVTVAPVFTVLLSWRFLNGDRPTGFFFLGALLAFCGIGLISFAGGAFVFSPVGDLLALGAGFSWAVYCVFTKKVGGFGYHVIQTTRRIFLYGLLFALPFAIGMEFRLDLLRFSDPVNVAGMLYVGLGSSAACFVFWNFAVRQLGPAKTSVYIYFSPLVAVMGAVLVLGETITWLKGLGIVLTLLGLALSNRRSVKREEVFAE